MDVIMLGYDIQGPVVSNKVDAVARAVVLASFGVLKDGGRHVESGGLARFSRDDQSVHIPASQRYLPWLTIAANWPRGFDCRPQRRWMIAVRQRMGSEGRAGRSLSTAPGD